MPQSINLPITENVHTNDMDETKNKIMKLASKICRISAGFGIVSLSSLFDLSEPKNKKKYSKISKKLMIS